MHKNTFWIGFIALISLAVLWWTCSTIYLYYNYASVSSETHAKKVNWSVFHKSSDQYLLNAEYTFEVNQQEFHGSTLLAHHIFRNPWAAEDALKQHMERPWSVWYSAKNPQLSTIEKTFPYKALISTGVLWVLLAYFIGVGYYVAKFQRRS